MAMITAYFDESGTHEGSPVTVVAGYVSTGEQWLKFDDEWKAILKDAEIPYFRMSLHQNRQDFYRNWDESKRNRILERLILTIRVRAQIPISASVAKSDYQEVFGESPEISPYTFCALQCLARIGEWAEKYNHDEPIAYVFESGAGYNREFDKLREVLSGNETRKKRYRFGSITFVEKIKATPLQASDILAYEIYKENMNFIFPGKEIRKLRYSAIKLLENKPSEYCGYYKKEELQSKNRFIPV
ncbi:MAG: DUF3800 domain-containing protein [Nitrospiria bacterium]